MYSLRKVNREGATPQPTLANSCERPPTSGARIALPTRCIRPPGSGWQGSLSLQTAFPPPPRIAAVPSVRWFCQTPETEMHVSLQDEKW